MATLTEPGAPTSELAQRVQYCADATRPTAGHGMSVLISLPPSMERYGLIVRRKRGYEAIKLVAATARTGATSRRTTG